MTPLKFYASGKLLLFGEYLVLRGSRSIAIPLSSGQTLTISPGFSNNLEWRCFEKEVEWLKMEFSPEWKILQTSDKEKAEKVQHLLKLISDAKPSLEIGRKIFRFDIDFNRNYGFGTSSTLISLLSQWSGSDPYYLLENSFGGSGFDVAAATSPGPFLYQIHKYYNETSRTVEPFHLSREISSKLLFVYTGRKQKSSKEVSVFKEISTNDEQINIINTIVELVLRCTCVENFEHLMDRSERLLSEILRIPPVKSSFFADYPYGIKSLGAWGGDFIMATFRDENVARAYFTEKGMDPIFNYQQLIKK